MNQILTTENKKKRRSNINKSALARIIRTFSIIMIIFGIAFITQGSYAIYKESKGNNTDNLPLVSISRVNDTINVVVSSTKKIENLIYNWNDSEETVVPVNANYAQEQILLPIEDSVLNIGVEEEDGRLVKYKKLYIIEGLDIKEPTIDIDKGEVAGLVKITATDETQMAYITYSVDEAEEIRIDRSEAEDKSINYVLKVEKGEHKITVSAVDVNGNIATKEKKVIVSAMSQVEANVIDGKLVITVKDQDGIKDIEINLNGLVYTVNAANQKGVRIPPLDIVDGNNTLRVKVTNVNSMETVETKEFNYGQ